MGIKMKKEINTSLIQYTTYDKNCPFDCARSIIDWLDNIDKRYIKDVANELYSHNGLNDFGQEIMGALMLMCGFRATNEGVPKKTLAFYKRYDKWVIENGERP